MGQTNLSFFDELTAALRGCVALALGRRDASSYFDFSQRGVIGSLIAAAVAIGLAGFGPMLFGADTPRGAATQSAVINFVLFVAQAATALFALRQMGRRDGFLPYLVASNWVTLASAILLLVSALLGTIGFVMQLVVAVFALATFINIGRLIVTLTPIQIGILFISQVVGVFLALGVIVALLPAPVLPAA